MLDKGKEEIGNGQNMHWCVVSELEPEGEDESERCLQDYIETTWTDKHKLYLHLDVEYNQFSVKCFVFFWQNCVANKGQVHININERDLDHMLHCNNVPTSTLSTSATCKQINNHPFPNKINIHTLHYCVYYEVNATVNESAMSERQVYSRISLLSSDKIVG